VKHNKNSSIRNIFIIFIVSVYSASLNAALISRNNGLAVYDTTLDVTWLSNANLALTESFGLPTDPYDPRLGGRGADPNYIQSNGSTTHQVSNQFINEMNGFNSGSGYLGVNTWRLPTSIDPDPSCTSGDPINGMHDCTGSELGHLALIDFNNDLNHPDRINLFTDFTSGFYWTGTASPDFDGIYDGSRNWAFFMNSGLNVSWYRFDSAYILPVADGDVFASAVPIPAAITLFGPGLFALLHLARSKKKY